jgi:hypothetical protein
MTTANLTIPDLFINGITASVFFTIEDCRRTLNSFDLPLCSEDPRGAAFVIVELATDNGVHAGFTFQHEGDLDLQIYDDQDANLTGVLSPVYQAFDIPDDGDRAYGTFEDAVFAQGIADAAQAFFDDYLESLPPASVFKAERAAIEAEYRRFDHSSAY